MSNNEYSRINREASRQVINVTIMNDVTSITECLLRAEYIVSSKAMYRSWPDERTIDHYEIEFWKEVNKTVAELTIKNKE